MARQGQRWPLARHSWREELWGGDTGGARQDPVTFTPAGAGLCGNFNGDTTDDFTTSMGIDEGTATLFVDSWRAGNCPAALERETDPCSMSQLNSEYPAPSTLGPGPLIRRRGDPRLPVP